MEMTAKKIPLGRLISAEFKLPGESSSMPLISTHDSIRGNESRARMQRRTTLCIMVMKLKEVDVFGFVGLF